MSNYAQISWEEDTPISTHFNDFYSSKESSLEESKYVFLEHNQLQQRFASLKDNEVFIIGETGFGAGINFFATCQLWLSNNLTNSQLHYISFEKYPLKPEDLSKIINKYPEYSQLFSEFIVQYKLLLPGFHRIHIAKNIYLTLVIGDIQDTISQITHQVDAWFLDGFSPSKNTSMWDNKLFQSIAKLSHQKTTFATYTANSDVRRTLINNNFTVYKDKGFGKKREMMFGVFSGSIYHLKQKPYFATSTKQSVRDIAIIGAGISGAATAYALAKRGYQVTIYERNSTSASEASGNHQGMLYGSWSSFDGELAQLSYSAYRYSHHLITSLLELNSEYQQCGITQLAHNKQQQKRNLQLLANNELEDIITHSDKLQNIDGQALQDAITFPSGIWLNPPTLVNKLLSNPNIKLICNSNIINLKILEDNTWQINDANNIKYHHDTVIICNSFMLNQFEQTKNIPIRKIRGQITEVTGQNDLKSVICGEGYITPPLNNKYTVGATFDFKNISCDATHTDNIENISKLNQISPILVSSIDIKNISGRANIRVSSYDYLPIVGPISDEIWFKTTYHHLSKDKNFRFKDSCEYISNLYINVAHGAKGMMSAPLSGEIIADYIDSTPYGVSEKLRQMLHPNRFWVRDLVKLIN